ncbi:hypothetical protein OXX79_002170 [Metschnikowia pulcherrima]
MICFRLCRLTGEFLGSSTRCCESAEIDDSVATRTGAETLASKKARPSETCGIKSYREDSQEDAVSSKLDAACGSSLSVEFSNLARPMEGGEQLS